MNATRLLDASGFFPTIIDMNEVDQAAINPMRESNDMKALVDQIVEQTDEGLTSPQTSLAGCSQINRPREF